jgi:hypothetical protein
VIQHESADYGIERSFVGDPVDVTLDEFDVAKTARGRSFSRESHRRRIAFDANDCAGITDESRRDHGDIAGAATEVEDALAGTNAGVA